MWRGQLGHDVGHLVTNQREERLGRLRIRPLGTGMGDAALQALGYGLIGLRPKRKKEREAAREDGSAGRLEQRGRSGSRPMGQKQRKEK